MGWRKLFGLQDAPEPPRSDPEAQLAARAFAIERERMFDLALTSRLGELFATPQATRDASWTAAFFAAV